MMIARIRTRFTALAMGLLLAGCASQTKPPATATTPAAAATATAGTHRSTSGTSASAKASHPAARARSEPAEPADATTGISACDDYLSSYRGCHRAAAIYAPDQIEMRYQTMRNSLLRDSRDPDIRSQLAARCNALAMQLRSALHGKACASEAAPTAATSSPSP